MPGAGFQVAVAGRDAGENGAEVPFVGWFNIATTAFQIEITTALCGAAAAALHGGAALYGAAAAALHGGAALYGAAAAALHGGAALYGAAAAALHGGAALYGAAAAALHGGAALYGAAAAALHGGAAPYGAAAAALHGATALPGATSPALEPRNAHAEGETDPWGDRHRLRSRAAPGRHRRQPGYDDKSFCGGMGKTWININFIG